MENKKEKETFPGFPYAEKYYLKVKNMSDDDRFLYHVLNINEFESKVLAGSEVYPGTKINYLCESVVCYFTYTDESKKSFNRGAYNLSEDYKYRLYGFCYALDMICDFYDDYVKFISYKFYTYEDDPKTHIPQRKPFVFYVRRSGEIYYTEGGEI